VTAYVARLGGEREEAVRVERVGPGRYEVELRGRTLRVDAAVVDEATLSLLVDGASHEVRIDRRPAGTRVHVDGRAHALEVVDERQARSRPPRR
jgi:hypothetical protein